MTNWSIICVLIYVLVTGKSQAKRGSALEIDKTGPRVIPSTKTVSKMSKFTNFVRTASQKARIYMKSSGNDQAYIRMQETYVMGNLVG